jgi:UDPglucose--hexose-1-phosphate uridylyltransferase
MEGSHLRKDPVTQRWVVISPSRAELPSPGPPVRPPGLPAEACPFCPGNEAKAGMEIHVEREPGSALNGPGWWVRVVPDKYPILHIEGGLGKSAEGMYDSMNAIGAHEILVETPEHEQHWAAMEVLQLERVLRAYQQRSLDLRNDVRFRHVIWVKNHGLSTSLFHHPHSHIVASPFVPRAIEEELKGFGDYVRWKERCVLCDMVKQESSGGRRIILRESGVVVFAPFAPRFPYESWIVPTDHGHDFGAARAPVLRDLARAVQDPRPNPEPAERPSLHAGSAHLPWVSSPERRITGTSNWSPARPRCWGWNGDGIYINPVPPEVAAERLRGVPA